MDADVIVVGAGLAGLVAAAELADAGQAGAAARPGAASSPSAARRSGRSAGCSSSTPPSSAGWASRTAYELALQDWMGSAQFDRDEDLLAAALGRGVRRLRRRREARVAARAWATGSSRSSAGPSAATAAPTATATRCRASTSPGAPARASSSRSSAGCASTSRAGRSTLRVPAPGRRALVDDGGAVTGVRGRGARARRRGRAAGRPTATRSATSSSRAQAVIVTSGGIGGNHDLVREAWPARLGTPPRVMVAGRARPRRRPDARHHRRRPAREIINPDRMWHYVEGIRNWDPIWDNHGIRILPGPSSLWFDATGQRLPAPYFPGLRHPRHAAATCARPATTTRGSCSPRRSSRRSSRSRAPSRTPTSPARTSSCCWAGSSARARRARSRRSRSTARTSSSPTRSPSWSPGMNRVGGRARRRRHRRGRRCAGRSRRATAQLDNAFTKDTQVTVHPAAPRPTAATS